MLVCAERFVSSTCLCSEMVRWTPAWIPCSNTSALKGFVGSYYAPENNLVRDSVDSSTLYLMNDVSGVSKSTDGGDTVRGSWPFATIFTDGTVTQYLVPLCCSCSGVSVLGRFCAVGRLRAMLVLMGR